MSHVGKVLMALASVLVIVACAGQPPQKQRYMVPTPQLEAHNQATSPRVVIGSVEVSPFLGGSGLVSVLADQQLHEARHHVWAEPLRDQLQRQVRTAMRQAYPNGQWLPLLGSAHLRSLDYRIDVLVDDFHLQRDGEVKVAGQWQLRDYEQSYLASGTFAHTLALSADGYPAMVEALGQAWQASLEGIAADLENTFTNSEYAP
jgi:uncharacterized protein